MVNVFELATGSKSALSLLNATFPEVDISGFYSTICIDLQKLLDSAVCTFEKLCGDVVSKADGHLDVTAITKAAGRVAKVTKILVVM